MIFKMNWKWENFNLKKIFNFKIKFQFFSCKTKDQINICMINCNKMNFQTPINKFEKIQSNQIIQLTKKQKWIDITFKEPQ